MESGLIFKLSFVHVSLQVGCRQSLETRHNNTHRFEEISQSHVLYIEGFWSQFHTNMQWKQYTKATQKLIKWQDVVAPQCRNVTHKLNLSKYSIAHFFPSKLQLGTNKGAIQLFISLKRESCSHIKNKFVTTLEYPNLNWWQLSELVLKQTLKT
jgi:hypothetical protein